MEQHRGGARGTLRAWVGCRRAGSAGLRRGFVALVVLGALAAHEAAAASDCKVQAMELPVTMVGTRAIATLGINGVDVPLMIDTGAFFSVLTSAAAAQLNLQTRRAPGWLVVRGLTGVVDMRMTTVSQLKLMSGELHDIEFLVGGNDPGNGAMGVLGRNLLTSLDAEYDLAHGVVRFMRTEGDCSAVNMAYWAGSRPVSMLDLERDPWSKLPSIEADAHVNGKKIRVMFDSGATSMLTLDAARRAGVPREAMVPHGRVTGMGEGDAQAWVAPVKTFEIGGEVIENNHLEIADLADDDDDDMLVGIDFFLSHRIYVSKRQRRMYFTYEGGPVFTLNQEDTAAPAAAAASGAEPPLADAAAYARRGAASVARHDLVHALADLDRACEMDPQAAGYFTRRAEVHALLKRPALARQDLDEALRLDPAQAEARLERATLREHADDRDGALADLAALDGTLAPQAQMRLPMADLYVRLGQRDRALPQWNQWIAFHRKEVGLDEVLADRCWTRVLLGVELREALDDCEQALDEQPKNAGFLESRGWVRLRLGQLAKAVADFDRSLKIDPDGAWALYGRGIARLRQGEVVAAQADLEAARRTRPAIDDEAGRYGIKPDAEATVSAK